MATVKDVAKKAGVSIATVSRVIRNEEIVTPKTREIVLSAIKELNYQPNALARQLRQQETNTVIVIVPDIGNTFFHEILLGIESEAEKYGYQVLIVDMHNKPDIESHYLHALQQRQVDGVISLSANVAKSLMEQVATSSPVVVACQYLDNSNIPNVTIDNIGAARTMVEYLIKLGHTRIAHLTSHPTALLYRDRFNGYISALANHNIPIDLELVKYGESTIASGYEMMSSLLELSNPVTAVFAAGDVMAIGALKALKNAGLNVPGDCSVAGFDDIEISSIFEPALTTISQPKLLMGKTSFKKLLKLMKGEPLAEQQELLNYKLIIRESCGKVKPSKKK
ncbi:LacI family DNA-binding transcriptional regulator [[Clostridium] symbiosum]|uniref:LacI family DNA-binding transcriptional regulator n=1 Tax=Clostridium symbiosum TaxID=1512 RepID=UPI001D07F86A|nr:LacI family DNA-binding transcriptional regulator [[Clostridium] symbiosum]MCB6609489.1 LacI family transcriptional regulator [[Clostridium] symbiosum]MCB6929518.1 LacI family transcriptional regulator [[Clostridium] symbiosum]